MTRKEQQRFDVWWRENRARLIRIYNEEIDLNLAVMNIADAVWEGSIECQKR